MHIYHCVHMLKEGIEKPACPIVCNLSFCIVLSCKIWYILPLAIASFGYSAPLCTVGYSSQHLVQCSELAYEMTPLRNTCFSG